MTANELVVVARLADHYEDSLLPGQGHDPLEAATRDFKKFKRDAPRLWDFLNKSKMSDRKLGDWLYEFVVRYLKSDMSLKNFSADELERLESGASTG